MIDTINLDPIMEAVGLHKFDATSDDELGFNKDHIIKVTTRLCIIGRMACVNELHLVECDYKPHPPFWCQGKTESY